MLDILLDDNEVKKILPILNEYNDWLPLVLFEYVNVQSYFSRVSNDVITDFYNRKHDLLLVENSLELLEYDLNMWIKENPEYSSILKSRRKD